MLSGSQKSSIFLELQIEELPQGTSAPFNCEIQCEGEGSETLSRIVDEKYAISYRDNAALS